MKALVLDGSPAGDALTCAAADAMVGALAEAGYAVDRAVVRGMNVRSCMGCFGCWTRRPGECVIDDDARRVAASMVASDVYAVVTPVRFGTYGSLAKRVMDRMICVLLPFFTVVDGEVHHVPRYPRLPAFVAFGTLRASDPGGEATFRRLVARNAINMYSPSHAVVMTTEGGDCAAAAREAIERVTRTEVAA